jgi:hypothetical protein
MKTQVDLLQAHNIGSTAGYFRNAARHAVLPKSEVAIRCRRRNKLKGILFVEIVGKEVE